MIVVVSDADFSQGSLCLFAEIQRPCLPIRVMAGRIRY